MSINEDTTVIAGISIPSDIEVETTATIKHASTGKVYESEDEATLDVNDPATETTESDIKRDVAVTVNKLPNIFGGSN